MKNLYTFTNEKEMFVNVLSNSIMNCAITDENEFLFWDPSGDSPWACVHQPKPKLVDEFHVGLGGDVVILKKFMAKYYPQIDVDIEFETHRPGVFRRFQEFDEDAYYEFQAYEKEQLFDCLQDELNERGYVLNFER